MKAIEGIHYTLTPSFHITTQGRKELDWIQQELLVKDFWLEKLGHERVFADASYTFADTSLLDEYLADYQSPDMSGFGITPAFEGRIADERYKSRRYAEEFENESRLGCAGYK